MNDQFDQPQRPPWRVSLEHDATSGGFRQRQRDFERRQREQQEREDLLRQQHGAELAKMIEVTSEIVHAQDEQVKAIALDVLVERIAERGVQPSQISPKDYLALCYQSIDDAFELQRGQFDREAAQRQDQPPEEQPRRQYDPRSHHYAELKETHLKVGEELKLDRADPVQEGQEVTDNEHAVESHYDRYAELNETHDRVRVERSQRDESTERQAAEMEQEVRRGTTNANDNHVELRSEQPDIGREIDDKAQRRQALMQLFDRSMEETFHREITQGDS